MQQAAKAMTPVKLVSKKELWDDKINRAQTHAADGVHSTKVVRPAARVELVNNRASMHSVSHKTHMQSHTNALVKAQAHRLLRTMKRGNLRAKKEKQITKENWRRIGRNGRREEEKQKTAPSEASMWWEKGGTPAEPRMVYPELFSDCFLTEQSVCMSQRERESESMCVWWWLREGILPLLLRTVPP